MSSYRTDGETLKTTTAKVRAQGLQAARTQ